jgi:hypothetical protein
VNEGQVMLNVAVFTGFGNTSVICSTFELAARV